MCSKADYNWYIRFKKSRDDQKELPHSGTPSELFKKSWRSTTNRRCTCSQTYWVRPHHHHPSHVSLTKSTAGQILGAPKVQRHNRHAHVLPLAVTLVSHQMVGLGVLHQQFMKINKCNGHRSSKETSSGAVFGKRYASDLLGFCFWTLVAKQDHHYWLQLLPLSAKTLEYADDGPDSQRHPVLISPQLRFLPPSVTEN